MDKREESMKVFTDLMLEQARPAIEQFSEAFLAMIEAAKNSTAAEIVKYLREEAGKTISNSDACLSIHNCAARIERGEWKNK
jgi:hypothetical protein